MVQRLGQQEGRGHKKTVGFEMWTWRRREKISWTEHNINENIMRRIGEESDLIPTVRVRQKKWVVHTFRGDSLLKRVIEGNMRVDKRGKDQDR